MPKVNRYGGTKQTVAEAVTALEARQGSEGVHREPARGPLASPRAADEAALGVSSIMHDIPEYGLFGLSPRAAARVRDGAARGGRATGDAG